MAHTGPQNAAITKVSIDDVPRDTWIQLTATCMMVHQKAAGSLQIVRSG